MQGSQFISPVPPLQPAPNPPLLVLCGEAAMVVVHTPVDIVEEEGQGEETPAVTISEQPIAADSPIQEGPVAPGVQETETVGQAEMTVGEVTVGEGGVSPSLDLAQTQLQGAGAVEGLMPDNSIILNNADLSTQPPAAESEGTVSIEGPHSMDAAISTVEDTTTLEPEVGVITEGLTSHLHNRRLAPYTGPLS